MEKIDLLNKENLISSGQQKVYTLLKELNDICERNGIKYFASGGTALGAIRHNGFIPWDDDADVHMTRDDFMKLISLPESEFPANRKITCWETDPHYNHTSARYIDTTTTVLYKHHTTREYDTGIMVDIVVLEPLPADPKKWQKHMDLFITWAEFRNPEVTSGHRWTGKTYYFKYNLLGKLIGKERLLKHLEKKVFCEPDDENTTAYHQRWAPVPWIFEKRLFGEGKRLPFNGMMLSVPAEVEDFLTQSYTDDWIMIPAVSNKASRTTHTSIEDEELPSKVYTRDFRRFLNDKEMFKYYGKRMRNLLKNRRFRGEFNEDGLYFYTVKAKQETEDYLKANGVTLKELTDARNYDMLDEALARFMGAQFTAACIGNISYAGWYRRNNPIALDVSDEMFYAGMILALHQGKLSKADRALKARFAKGSVTEELKELRGLIDAIHEAASAYYHKNFEAAKSICEKWLKKFDDNADLLRIAVAIDFETAKSEEEERAALERSMHALNLYSSDDVFRFITAELLIKPWSLEEDKTYTALIQDENGNESLETFTARAYSEMLISEIMEEGSNGRILMILRRRLEAKLRENPDDEEAYSELYDLLKRTGVEFEGEDEEEEEDEDETADEEVEDEVDDAETYKRVVLDMLGEIDSICKKYDIEYFVTGRLALAVGKEAALPLSFANGSVAMTPQSFIKFREAFYKENPKDRKLDSLLDNKNFPHFGARYCNENTLHFSTRFHKYYASRGIAIEIDMLRGTDNSKGGKLAFALESGWEFMHYKMFGYRKKPALVAAFIRVAKIFTGKKNFAKIVFNTCAKHGKTQNAKKLYIRPFDGKTKVKHYDKSIFEKPVCRQLEKMSLPFAAKLEDYLKIRFGENWEEMGIGGSRAGANNVKDAVMPYKEYEALLDKQKVNLCWKKMRHLNNINAKNAAAQKHINDYWHIMLRSGERVRLYKLYSPQKERIMQLDGEKKYDELFELLGEFFEQIKFFDKWDMGLCFDKDIFDVMVRTLDAKGLKSEAKKLIKNTPKSIFAAPDLSI